MTPRPASHPTQARIIGRFRLVALVLPLVVAVVGLVVSLVALPHLPDPVAIHWGPGGTADGFGSTWTTITAMLVLGVALPALVTATSLPSLRRGERGPTYRFLGSVAFATTTFVTALGTASLVAQWGLADARNAPSIGPVALGAGIIGALAALAGWFLQPAQAAHDARTRSPEATELSADERAVWVRTAELSLSGRVVLGIVVLLMWVGVVISWASGAPAPVLVMLGFLALVVTLAVAALAGFRVRVDAAGITATGLLGWPRARVRAADVARVDVVQVAPFGQFGGWGWRVVPGATGIVVRAGEGIQVQRRSGRSLVVTVDDADRGAALLRAYAERAAGRADSGSEDAAG